MATFEICPRWSAPAGTHFHAMGQARSAIVIGGGVVGVTSAYVLARDGWQVRVVERNAEAGSGASYGNGRQLSYSHTNALAGPAILKQIPALMLGCDPAFRLRIRANPAFFFWALDFLRNCTSSLHRQNTLETLSLAVKSREAMERLLAIHSIDFDQKSCGKIVILRSEREIKHANAMMSLKQQAGLDQRLLTPSEAVEHEPALAQIAEPFAGALFAPGDETGDCHAFTNGLLSTLQADYGAQFTGGSAVSGLTRQSGKTVISFENGDQADCDLAVVANGHQASALAQPLGHRIPIEPMKGYSFTAPIGNAAPKISVTDHKRRIVFTNIGDRMLVAGIAEIGKVDSSIDQSRMRSMVHAAQSSLPEAAVYSQHDEGWSGFRPMTPNSQPITRMLEPGIAVNAGHGMLGWTLAMGSAERLGQAVREAT